MAFSLSLQDWTGLDFRSIMNEAEKIRSTVTHMTLLYSLLWCYLCCCFFLSIIHCQDLMPLIFPSLQCITLLHSQLEGPVEAYYIGLCFIYEHAEIPPFCARLLCFIHYNFCNIDLW